MQRTIGWLTQVLRASSIVTTGREEYLALRGRTYAIVTCRSSGTVEITASRPPKSEGVSGHGVVTNPDL